MTTKAFTLLLSLILTLHTTFVLVSTLDAPGSIINYSSPLTRPFIDHADPRENITAQFNTCDFDLVQLLNDESIIDEFSEQCQSAYHDPELKNLLLQESQLFNQINEKIGAYEKQQDPDCDPFEEGRREPCPKMDYDLRLGMHNVTDIMTCQNSTGHYEFAQCMVEMRNEMLVYLETII